MSAPRLRVVSLNIWGLPDLLNRAPGKINRFGYGKVARSERLRRIISRLDEFDVICFQEVWVRSDRKKLIAAASECGLTHWRYFHSGRSLSFLSRLFGWDEDFGDGKLFSGLGIGSGMLIVSRYPISRSEYRSFSLCGKPQRFHHGMAL